MGGCVGVGGVDGGGGAGGAGGFCVLVRQMQDKFLSTCPAKTLH